MTFTLLHYERNPAFQPIAEACVFYVYVILLFIPSELWRSPAVAKCPAGMKRKNVCQNGPSCLKKI